MNVVHVAPPFLALDESMKYGGTERVINSLRRKQKELGLETRVLACSDSTVEGLIPTVKSIGVNDIYGKGIEHDTVRRHTYIKLDHIAQVLSYAQQHPDVLLHVHDDFLLPFLSSLPHLSIMTVHSDYGTFWQTEEHPQLTSSYQNMVAISQSHKRELTAHNLPIRAVVYNGLEASEFPFLDKKDDFLLSLSAIAPHKGQHIAIDVAQKAGKTLVIAGNITDLDYFNSFKEAIQFDLSDEKDKFTAYKALPAGQKIVYVGSVNDEQKKPLYAHAEAFLMPISWEEPFGLVMIEALACGTPVLAFDRGAAPEIVQSGVNGYICHDVGEMIQKLGDLKSISPQECRRGMEQNFSLDKMARDYLRLYEEIGVK